MGQNIPLIIHNIVSIISGLSSLGLAVFTYLNAPRKTANVAFAIMLLMVAVFVFSHVIGVNISDPNLSRIVLMFNLSIFVLGAFNLHATYALVNKEKEGKFTIIVVYIIALAFVAFFIIFPDLFLLPSVPKMYFPNYYNPGIFNWTRVAFLYCVIVPYMIYLFFKEFRKETNVVLKQQYQYLIITYVIGWAFGYIPNFLVFNISIDPMYGMAFVILFTIPFIYGSVKYGMFNVKIIAQQAFFYSIGVFIVGGLIVLLEYSNTILSATYPGFPTWITAFVSGVLAMTISVFIWRSLRQNDILKYEFITTVTHKFRTPLTYIKWASENLANPQMSAEERQTQINYIQSANEKLVELTDILANASDAENKAYEYKLERGDLTVAVDETIASLGNQFDSKHLIIVKKLTPGIFAMFDATRIKFVIQVFLENALHYTPEGGAIIVTTAVRGKEAIFSVHDSGIGISKDQLALLFSKFYRSDEARKADTEGMGIGLYISREIINKHRGRIEAASEGENKGSTFTFAIPLAKEK